LGAITLTPSHRWGGVFILRGLGSNSDVQYSGFRAGGDGPQPALPTAVLFANGDFNDGPAVRAALALSGPRIVIAADGGLRHVEQLGLTADLVVGDMDSVEPEALLRAEKAGAQIVRASPRKDETDLELALLAAAARGCIRLRVIGAVGSRLDQTLANVYLLALPSLRGCDVASVSFAQTIWLARPGTVLVRGSAGDTLSLLPIDGDAEEITTQGLEYPLRGETLHFGPARGVSNVMTQQEAEIRFKRGLLLLVHSVGRA
jgi:thiamine pyrophosphokinase